MTMPRYMNCAHHPDGWCLDCVDKLHREREKDLEEYQITHVDIGTAQEHLSNIVDELKAILEPIKLEKIHDIESANAISKARVFLDRIFHADEVDHAMMNGPRIQQSLGPIIKAFGEWNALQQKK